MTIPKRNGLYVANVVFPLVCGLYVYLTKAERTYISDCLSVIRLITPTVNYPYIIRNFACDFLWTYSMFFCLRLILGEPLKSKYNFWVIAVTAFVATILEIMQLIHIIPGTFDCLDILAELIAIVVADLITITLERRFKKYERK